MPMRTPLTSGLIAVLSELGRGRLLRRQPRPGNETDPRKAYYNEISLVAWSYGMTTTGITSINSLLYRIIYNEHAVFYIVNLSSISRPCWVVWPRVPPTTSRTLAQTNRHKAVDSSLPKIRPFRISHSVPGAVIASLPNDRAHWNEAIPADSSTTLNS